MAKISEIIEKIEKFAPPELQCDWDNSGWQVYLANEEINRVLLALTPTEDVINQAINRNCKFVITHHPAIFEKIKCLRVNDQAINPVIKAIQNNIQLYSAHTNLDSTQNGIADNLARLLELKNIRTPDGESGELKFIRLGELENEENIYDYTSKIKNILGTVNPRLINPSGITKVKKIAVCPGAGGDILHLLKDVELYVTADIGYHDAVEQGKIAIFDAGHLETERIILPVVAELIKQPDLEVIIADEVSPWSAV